jgi:DNA-binding CsgD family transcriptional regulator
VAKTASSQLLDLIGQTYDAALDEALWPKLVPEIASAFQSASTAVQVRPAGMGNPAVTWNTPNLTSGLMQEYAAYYWQHDVWVGRASALGLSRVFASKDLISDRALELTEFCQDWLRKTGTFYVVGSVFPIAPGETGVLGIHRERASGTYDESDKTSVNAFLPHLQRALQIRRRLSHAALERHATLDALQRTGTATLVVARSGHILYANALAEGLLNRGDALYVVAGRLSTEGRGANEWLARAITEAVDAAAGRDATVNEALAIDREDRLPLTLLVAPLRPAQDGFGTSVPAAIVFVRDPEQATPSSLALRSLFGLTSAEASVAGALAAGKSIDEIAASNGVTLNTVRTHLKNVLAKTGTSRQAELVALLLRSVAAIATK